MRVYISVDMEGIAGVVHGGQCRKGQPDYAAAAELMTHEANAAALGAFDAGADEVLINDSHGDMQNLSLELLDPRVQVISGALKQFSMAEGFESGRFHVALFVGYHGGAGTAHSILDHTYRSTVVSQVRMNGREVNEAALNALVAGHSGTPVGLVTGDENACRQCKEMLGDVETVVVKWAVGRLAARSLHPKLAREKIREASKRVASAPERFKPFAMEAPYRLEVDVLSTGHADAASLMPGVRRTSDRTLAFDSDEVLVAFQALLAIVRLAGTSR